MESRDRSNSQSEYGRALDLLSSLSSGRDLAGLKKGGNYYLDLMYQYLKMLELEEPVSKMKVIHVAGTKGKGSTCAFTESILRHCGFRTGLFTSPHLIDIRERFLLDGVAICEEKFLANFWWCWDKLKEKSDNLPMPMFFSFYTLLAFKIFTAEQVDVVILEVGIGGKFDSTNVVESPIVCGITSLGYDHTEILGNTLREIAGEKAGIFKRGVPAFTVLQPVEAMSALEYAASQLGIVLRVATPLNVHLLNGLKLGLDGDHQYLNAGLAIALSYTWLEKTEQKQCFHLDQADFLPEKFVRGLTTANLQGRAQIVVDPDIYLLNKCNNNTGGLAFYLDGAHSPESMEVCGRWFCRAVRDDAQLHSAFKQLSPVCQGPINSLTQSSLSECSMRNSTQILLFNCMTLRDPDSLLPHLINACAHHGVYFHKAIFVPDQLTFNKVQSHAIASSDAEIDLSWQLKLQRVWESLVHSKRGGSYDETVDLIPESGKYAESETSIAKIAENSVLFSSLPEAIKWLRDCAKDNSILYQVLVTGSLKLVGEVLRLVKE